MEATNEGSRSGRIGGYFGIGLEGEGTAPETSSLIVNCAASLHAVVVTGSEDPVQTNFPRR